MGEDTMLGSLLDQPLDVEICFRLAVTALDRVRRSRGVDSDRVSLSDLPELAASTMAHGRDACIPHPAVVEEVFGGVTHRDFRSVQTLYCNRLQLSIMRVTEIINLVRCRDGITPLHREAIIAVCLYLERRRQEAGAVTIVRSSCAWQISFVHLPFVVTMRNGRATVPKVVCVLDNGKDEVIAFRIVDAAFQEEAALLALYDAIASQRHPKADAAVGLEWILPAHLWIDSAVHCQVLRRACDALSINAPLHKTNSSPQSSKRLIELTSRWSGSDAKTLTGIPVDRLAMMIDQSLYRIQGYGPLQQGFDFARTYSGLSGYSLDPAVAFPAIRLLLPVATARIDDGAVLHDGLHYSDSLLYLWPDQEVHIRRSLALEARGWIYADGEILCEAHAVELRRKDGTFRSSRSGAR